MIVRRRRPVSTGCSTVWGHRLGQLRSPAPKLPGIERQPLPALRCFVMGETCACRISPPSSRGGRCDEPGSVGRAPRPAARHRRPGAGGWRSRPRQLLGRVRRTRASPAAATSLRDHFGLSPGNRVAIVMRNRPEYLEALFAIWHAGLVVVPVNARLHRDEIAYILDDSESAVAMVPRPRPRHGRRRGAGRHHRFAQGDRGRAR